MADTKISALTDGATAAATDRIPAARSPFGSTDNRYLTPAYIKDYILGLANTWAGAQTATQFITSGNGSAAAPAYRVGATSGLYLNTTNSLTFAVAGSTNVGTFTSSTWVARSGTAIGWASTTDSTGTLDTQLVRDAANTVALQRTTTAQVLRGYRTFTDASNYERWALQTGSGYIELAAETAGTGGDNQDVRLTPAGTGGVNFPGGVLLKTRAALTDGAAAASGTLLNAPTAGNPTKWVPIDDNGTTRYIPCW